MEVTPSNATNAQQGSAENGGKARGWEENMAAGGGIDIGDDKYAYEKVRITLINIPILLVSPDLFIAEPRCDDTEAREFNPSKPRKVSALILLKLFIAYH